ncbi:pre-mRNA processing factor 3-domain-containing protein [Lipomyces japonicus]|uniref:pre-mRNA processing factor 3-domain-containing protein n=1 Tax=Lipomyces japonicus TaxID=56871 RepID=UPI0034CE84B0
MTDARKRALDGDLNSPTSKKLKSHDGSPAPLLPTGSTGTAGSANDIIARAKEIARQRRLAAAQATAERIENQRLNGSPALVSAPLSTPAQVSSAAPAEKKAIDIQKVMADIAERKRKIAEATAAISQSTVPPTRTPPSHGQQANPDTSSHRNEGDGPKVHGGLNVGLHPALLNDIQHTALKQRQQQAKSKKQLELLNGPSQDEVDPSKNPYYDPNIETRPKERTRRALEFNEKGKYIEQGNAIRAQAKLEELKKRIQASSKIAGLDEEIDVADMALKREEPPNVEWWDQPLLTNETYEDIDNASLLKIYTEDSPITIYIQHPVPIAAPWAKNEPIIRPPHLTKKEIKRIRKSERAEKHKDKQDRIRLGLDPAPPPKVKLSNLMSVLTNEAIKDPTMVEQRVRREVAERAEKHAQDNLERQLTAEEKHRKIQEKLENDEKRGIVSAVFRIDSMENSQHRYKVNVNARQLDLKGVTILNPKFNLVVVEGGAKAVNQYKKLLLNRIDWTDSSYRNQENGEYGSEPSESVPNLSNNTCEIIWEGELKQHLFRRWNTRTSESEAEAREILERNHTENYWNLAKNWKHE